MNKSLPSFLELAVLAYCAFQARELPESWWSAPAVRFGWVAFLVWLSPLLIYLALTLYFQRTKGNTPLFLAAAIAATLLGTLGSLNILKHTGLAFACAGMLPFTWPVFIWLACAIAWMPGFGWLAKALPFHLIFFVQIAATAIGSLALIQFGIRRLHYEQ